MDPKNSVGIQAGDLVVSGKAVQDAEGRELPLARLAEVPKEFGAGALATEDHNFYSHHGFDLRGIAPSKPSGLNPCTVP